jgi:methylthioribose-1-phosphate isomerase
MRTVFWEDNQLKMIDQRILPGRFEVVSFKDHVSVARAIKDMVVRGAPAIGASAAGWRWQARPTATSTVTCSMICRRIQYIESRKPAADLAGRSIGSYGSWKGKEERMK